MKILKASCALPMFFAPMEIDGKHYLDGGLGESIPCERAVFHGCDRIVVVLTKPEGVGPGEYSKYMRIIRHMYPDFPKIWEACEMRLERYAKSMEYLRSLEESGRAFVIRPQHNMSKFERDNTKLRAYYKHGYDAARASLPRLREFLSRRCT